MILAVPCALRMAIVSRDTLGGMAARCLYSCRDMVKAMARVSSKNQVTLPVAALRAAGLKPGDEVTVRPVGAGTIVIAARGSRVRRHAGIATGIYEPGELDQLRDEWDC
jgi:bifunctional DNA-binding transcriptional regulator/antitoxin component of YhaV-PrlF toxin-antitoxin module